MRNFMYLRPGNLYKVFTVEESKTVIKDNGRAVPDYSSERNLTVTGCLAQARTSEIARFAQIGHPITHTIVQVGRRIAKEDDRMHLKDRTFLVKGIDEAGSLGVCTIYYVEERNDVK